MPYYTLTNGIDFRDEFLRNKPRGHTQEKRRLWEDLVETIP